MTLPASGAISFNDVNNEIAGSYAPGSYANGSQISLDDAAVRDLFDVPTGAISMSNGYSKAALRYADYIQGGYYAGQILNNHIVITENTLTFNEQWNTTNLGQYFTSSRSSTNGIINTTEFVNGGYSGVLRSIRNSTQGGYSDWYCPANQELLDFPFNQFNALTTSNNVMTSAAQWSSTEFTGVFNVAYVITIPTGSTSNDNTLNARPARGYRRITI